MTSTLLMLGASLIDAGNVSRASDDRVMGEQIVSELGADPNEDHSSPFNLCDTFCSGTIRHAQ